MRTLALNCICLNTVLVKGFLCTCFKCKSRQKIQIQTKIQIQIQKNTSAKTNTNTRESYVLVSSLCQLNIEDNFQFTSSVSELAVAFVELQLALYPDTLNGFFAFFLTHLQVFSDLFARNNVLGNALSLFMSNLLGEIFYSCASLGYNFGTKSVFHLHVIILPYSICAKLCGVEQNTVYLSSKY